LDQITDRIIGDRCRAIRGSNAGPEIRPRVRTQTILELHLIAFSAHAAPATGTIQLVPGSAGVSPGVSPALVGVPLTRSDAATNAPIGFRIRAHEAIGETPMAATETVALPGTEPNRSGFM